MSDNKFHPSTPTVPFPDQFQNLQMFFGFSKIEEATLKVLAGILANPYSMDKLDRVTDHAPTKEMVARAYAIAECAIEYCEQKLRESEKTSSNLIS